MLTSGSVPGDPARCRELGAQAYLTKPVRAADLLTSILHTLQGADTGPDTENRSHRALAAMNAAVDKGSAPQPSRGLHSFG